MDALFRRHSRRRGHAAGQYLFERQGAAPAAGRGRALPAANAAWATPGDIEHTEAGGCLPGAEPDCVSERALRTRRRPVRHARLGQPLPRSAGGRRDLSTRRPPRRWASTRGQICVMIHSGSRGLGYQVCDDALTRLRKAPGQVRHRAARPAVGLRPGRKPGGPGVPRRDACGGQLRLVQPAAADVADARGLRRVLRPPLGIAADEPGLRRGPQHRQDGGARRSTAGRRRCACIARGRRGPFPPAIPRCPSATGRSASR